MSAFWERVGGHLERGERVFVACVAEHTRGSPGTAGAKLLVAEGGGLFGTVGGGMMEHRLVEQARTLLREGGAQPEKHTLVHSDTAEGERSGLVCEGSQTNVFCVLAGDRDRATVAAIAAAVSEDRAAWMVIDGAGLRLTEREPDFPRPPFALTGEGERWRYEEDLLNRRRLAVIGGGHCAVALAEVTARLGYRAQIFDTRTEVVTHDRAAALGTVTHVADYAAAGPLIAYPRADRRGGDDGRLPDRRARAARNGGPAVCLRRPDGWQAQDRPDLRPVAGGRVPQEALDQVHAPVGLDIGSDTPEEIAVSVAAQILRERNRA